MATGVLVVGINRATRLLTYIVGTPKTYTATIRLGQSTVTDDAEGELIAESSADAVSPAAIQAAVADLTGAISQVPSSVSAIKIKGERAYNRVRSGEDVVLPPRPVTVHSFEISDIRRENGGAVQDLDVTVRCSSGTYIRALARDLGAALGVGGHLTVLRRTEVGPYTLDAASTLDELAQDFRLLGIDEAARALFPVRELSAAEAQDLSHGRRISAGADAGARPSSGGKDERPVAAFAPGGALIALLEDRGAEAKPVLVFAPAEAGT
jgi:tRNA pseudouridine55 synthase